MNSILFSKKSFSTGGLPAPYNTMEEATTDPNAMSELNQGKKLACLNAGVVKAVLSYFGGETAEIALVKISETVYATEAALAQGRLIASLQANGTIRAAVVTEEGYRPLPHLRTEEDFDAAPLLLGFFPILREKFEEVNALLEQLEGNSNRHEPFDGGALYKLSDALYRIFTEKKMEIDDQSGAIALLEEQTVSLGGMRYHKVLCGTPVLLCHTASSAGAKAAVTVAEAKELFRAFSAQFQWAEEELDLIPVFDDSFPVPEETMKLARRFVHSRSEQRPMVNFMWRGITAYGKSTGVEVMACILHMPLLRVTCHSNMETQDFLSDFVPNAAAAQPLERPSFAEIAENPAGAYFRMTGSRKEDATPDQCMEAYASLVRETQSNVPRFKHVASNYVKALEKGYIVEVQEISRIKDSGVLVGLNEYDRPGAVIPLVDGSHTRRHRNAVVVYTDNVGYNSCRLLDPSVIRRMACIIDSYDMPKQKVFERLYRNTRVEEQSVLETCYTVWSKLREFCQDKGITDGSISVSELEMWVLTAKLDGFSDLKQDCIECVVAKGSNDMEEQAAMISSVVDLYL